MKPDQDIRKGSLVELIREEGSFLMQTSQFTSPIEEVRFQKGRRSLPENFSEKGMSSKGQ